MYKLFVSRILVMQNNLFKYKTFKYFHYIVYTLLL